MVVRPKDHSSLSARQRPFMRSSVIVRSQTFSPGERSQYVCRVRLCGVRGLGVRSLWGQESVGSGVFEGRGLQDQGSLRSGV